jgi:3'-phosphoadenosine 5'-phosphosulfate (PAPS) 3'-phosphatase
MSTPIDQLQAALIKPANEIDLHDVSIHGPTMQGSLLEVAMRTVGLTVELGELALELRERGLQRSKKPDGSIVTNADIALSEILVRRLPLIVPVQVISEENFTSLDFAGFKQDEFRWLADPIDATRAYAEGYPDFCQMTSLIRDGKLYMAVVGGPAMGVVYFAIAGGGAYKLDLHGMTTKKISSAYQNQEVLAVASFYHLADEQTEWLRRGLAGNDNRKIQFTPEASGLKYCYVAEGRYAASGGAKTQKIWDLMPALILQEAGGQMVSAGGELSFNPNHPVIELPVALAHGINFDY